MAGDFLQNEPFQGVKTALYYEVQGSLDSSLRFLKYVNTFIKSSLLRAKTLERNVAFWQFSELTNFMSSIIIRFFNLLHIRPHCFLKGRLYPPNPLGRLGQGVAVYR